MESMSVSFCSDGTNQKGCTCFIPLKLLQENLQKYFAG